ncbi:MAG: rod shape-determining protein RodA [Deltaproteobacteria bacterium]|nr:rod shape-determining protein RodA [Deltaproteobacteria bacterium]
MTGRALWRRFKMHFDWVLLLVVVLICSIGLLNLYSATRYVTQSGLFGKQVMLMLVGLFLFFLMAVLDYRAWVRVAWLVLLIGTVAVVAVHFSGYAAKGSQRWLGWQSARIQPSEFIKLAVIIALARLVHDSGSQEIPWSGILLRVSALGVVVILIAWQPDLGTATLVGLIAVSVAVLASRRLWPFLVGIVLTAAAVPVMWSHLLADYQKKRILTFLDPQSDPSGAGWHARQSIFAVGSGRLLGKGYMHGTQNQLNFLPEQWTDFPFSVWAEEWGFLGVIVLLGLYLFLILWMVHVASQARDRFGAVLCVGVAALLFWHVFVNIAMVTGLAPVVGVTLPLVSYGGSSVLTVFLGLGLVASVSMRRFAR